MSRVFHAEIQLIIIGTVKLSKNILRLCCSIMGFLEERDLTDVPAISEFFRGKTIFITGGSGFMGKVLIEKLLYSCTDLQKIYLLLRSKKGVNPDDRLQNLYTYPCFDRLRKERPGAFHSKVAVLAGDVTDVGLGLSPENRELIIKNVNIIFHVAASVRFDEPLPVSTNINICSTVEILEIAKEMKNLNALVHVSTAYSNIRWNHVEEAIYPSYAGWRDTLKICENIDKKTLSFLSSKYLGDIPNTYILTKQLAEHVIYEQRGKLPIVIIRPSLVISSKKEPMPGWIENFNGPIGISVGVGKGVLRCLYTKEDMSANYVPVDLCIKHFIAAAWIRGTKELEPSDDIEIYNCCSKERVTVGLLFRYGKEIYTQIPFENIMWNLNCTTTTSKTLYYLNVLFKHILPALLIDMLLWISGKKPMLLKLQRKIFANNLILQKFIINEWSFATDNFNKLCYCLKKEDLSDFCYDMRNFFTEQYFTDCVWGAKRYLLKEKDENLSKAKKYMKRINMLDTIIRYATYTAVAWALISNNLVRNLYRRLQAALY